MKTGEYYWSLMLSILFDSGGSVVKPQTPYEPRHEKTNIPHMRKQRH